MPDHFGKAVASVPTPACVDCMGEVWITEIGSDIAASMLHECGREPEVFFRG